MLRRRWLVVAMGDDGIEVMHMCWTRRGAWRKRYYWQVLFRHAGNRTPLEVIHT